MQIDSADLEAIFDAHALRSRKCPLTMTDVQSWIEHAAVMSMTLENVRRSVRLSGAPTSQRKYAEGTPHVELCLVFCRRSWPRRSETQMKERLHTVARWALCPW